MTQELKIDPEFRDKIPPLTEAEFKQLEENILTDGEIREPIITWNNTIIDGHHRWEIIQKHPEIPYKVIKMTFADKWEAIVWMCKNQLGKRNLTDEQKTYLIGKEYEAQKKAAGGDRKSSCQNGNLIGKKTAQVIADNNAIGYGTVIRAEKFSKGLDVADAISPGFKESILSGTVKAPKSTIAQIAKMDEPEQKKAVAAIQKGERVRPSMPKQEETYMNIKEKAPVTPDSATSAKEPLLVNYTTEIEKRQPYEVFEYMDFCFAMGKTPSQPVMELISMKLDTHGNGQKTREELESNLFSALKALNPANLTTITEIIHFFLWCNTERQAKLDLTLLLGDHDER